MALDTSMNRDVSDHTPNNFLALLRPPLRSVREIRPHPWDPLREELRDRALLLFRGRRFLVFRRWLEDSVPMWSASPTANLLYGLCLLYEGYVEKSFNHLNFAREAWEERLNDGDLGRGDVEAMLVTAITDLAFAHCAVNEYESAEVLLRDYLDKLCLDEESNERTRAETASELSFHLLRIILALRGPEAFEEFAKDMEMWHPNWREDRSLWSRVASESDMRPYLTGQEWEKLKSSLGTGLGRTLGTVGEESLHDLAECLSAAPVL